MIVRLENIVTIGVLCLVTVTNVQLGLLASSAFIFLVPR